MTRDELIEKVARSICAALPGTGNIDDHFAKEGYVRSMWLSLAEAAIDTIFDAMKETTEEMSDEGLSYDDCGVGAIYRSMLNASPLPPKED